MASPSALVSTDSSDWSTDEEEEHFSRLGNTNHDPLGLSDEYSSWHDHPFFDDTDEENQQIVAQSPPPQPRKEKTKSLSGVSRLKELALPPEPRSEPRIQTRASKESGDGSAMTKGEAIKRRLSRKLWSVKSSTVSSMKLRGSNAHDSGEHRHGLSWESKLGKASKVTLIKRCHTCPGQLFGRACSGRKLEVAIMNAENVPTSRVSIMRSHYSVRIRYPDQAMTATTRLGARENNGRIIWNQENDQDACILVPYPEEEQLLNQEITFELVHSHRKRGDSVTGSASVTIGYLASKRIHHLMLSMRGGDVLVGNGLPSFLNLRVANVYVEVGRNQELVLQHSIPLGDMTSPSLLSNVHQLDEPNQETEEANPIQSGRATTHETRKHVMMMTRGTRGDIEPFVALARGLAKNLGWKVTIVTELAYREFVLDNAHFDDSCRGEIHFRPSGGDTGRRVNSKLCRWAVSKRWELLQMAMLARSEGEFFSSEPAFYYWADHLKPDVLIFGFTVANVAMILSEALQIPLVGFILQPTVIPSAQYPPIIPLSASSMYEPNHAYFQVFKTLMENNPFYPELNYLRKRRDLKPMKRWRGKKSFHSETWSTLVGRKVPLIVPIHPVAFGGTPPDWNPQSVLTTNIFLRNPRSANLSLKPEIEQFLRKAKSPEVNAPVVVMAFSSMPVPRDAMLKLANKIITRGIFKPRVIAVVGKHNLSKESRNLRVESLSKQLKQRDMLLEIEAAPFSALFPRADALIVHGGLGTTAEALKACVPVIVTGVLLLDQRFWGQRMKDLGIGPRPIHITKFSKCCVDVVDKATDPNGEWSKNAKKLGREMENAIGPDGKRIEFQQTDGVDLNVFAITHAVNIAPVYKYR